MLPPLAVTFSALLGPAAEGTPDVSVMVPELLTLMSPAVPAGAWALVIARPNPLPAGPEATVPVVNDTAPSALNSCSRLLEGVRVALVLVLSVVVVVAQSTVLGAAATAHAARAVSDVPIMPAETPHARVAQTTRARRYHALFAMIRGRPATRIAGGRADAVVGDGCEFPPSDTAKIGTPPNVSVARCSLEQRL